MWKVLFTYEAEEDDGVVVTKEGRHSFDRTNTFGDVLLALHALNGDDVITKCSIGYYDKTSD